MTNEIKISIFILLSATIGLSLYWFSSSELKKNPSYTLEEERILLPQYSVETYRDIPEVQEYLTELRELIKNGKSVLPLESSQLDNNEKIVQEILLKDRDFLRDTVDNGKILHNDMMQIRPALIGSINKKLQEQCREKTCYEAQKYNFVKNSTTIAIVEVENKTVIEVNYYPNMQPDISLRLKHIAQAIALNAPEIKKTLKEKPQREDMSMANVRGALQGSPCENSEHLCVAPTFSNYKDEEALWAIIDLTELKLSAVKWAGLGKTATPACISERSLQNRYIMKNFCEKDTKLVKNNWKFLYRLTGSDGLEVIDASFKNKPVFRSAKIVDWHVAYKGKGVLGQTQGVEMAGRKVEFVEGDTENFFFGYNDAMGCPMFSTSVVLPFNAPLVKELYDKNRKKVGFYLTQDFRNPKWPMACNYRYENRFEFFDDGSFRVVGVNKGRGCGEDAIYRPVMRIDMNLGEENFYKYNGSWIKWLTEQSDSQKNSTLYSNDKYLYKIQNKLEEGYYIEPNRGQFNDASRGDNATIFVTKYKKEEGNQDLLTLGSCCNLDEDGVERYLSKTESIENENLVIWYVPRIKNDARKGHEYCWADTVVGSDGNLEVKEFPCAVGAKFVPINLK